MKVENYKCGGKYTIAINVPTTEAEYNALAKRGPTACVNDAVDKTAYHATLGDARDKVIELLEAKHGVKREERPTGKTDSDGNPITKDEPFEMFLDRVASVKGLKGDLPHEAEFKAVSFGGAHEVKFDPSVAVRSSKPPKLPGEYLTAANDLIGKKLVDKVAIKYEKVVGKPMALDTTLKGEELAKAFGWKLREITLEENKKKSVEDRFVGKV